jgi:hypothetical protein
LGANALILVIMPGNSKQTAERAPTPLALGHRLWYIELPDDASCAPVPGGGGIFFSPEKPMQRIMDAHELETVFSADLALLYKHSPT